MDRELLKLVTDIQELLALDDAKALKAYLDKLHPSDLAEVIEELPPDDGARLLALTDEEDAAEALDEMDGQTQREVIAELESPEIAGILEQMADDDLADLMAELGTEEAERVLGMLDKEDAADVKQLLGYPEDTAGGIMTTDFFWVPEMYTAAKAIDHLRHQAREVETVNYIYVLGPAGRLRGVLSLRELLVSDPSVPVRDVMERELVTVAVTEDQEEVARAAMHYDLLAVPVIGDDGRMLGIVTIDDIIDVLDEEAAEDMHGVAHGGKVLEEAEAARHGVWARVRLRLPWLILLMFGDFLSANVISRFEGVLSTFVALAFFIPVLMDMGGNVGTQSLAMTVRGLATGEIDRSDLPRLLWRESGIGITLGIVCGTLIGLVAMVWQGTPVLGIVVGSAMAVTMGLAAILGTVVPMIFDRLGVDSAVASSPFITSSVDVFGLLTYFAVATRVLHLLT